MSSEWGRSVCVNEYTLREIPFEQISHLASYPCQWRDFMGAHLTSFSRSTYMGSVWPTFNVPPIWGLPPPLSSKKGTEKELCVPPRPKKEPEENICVIPPPAPPSTLGIILESTGWTWRLVYRRRQGIPLWVVLLLTFQNQFQDFRTTSRTSRITPTVDVIYIASTRDEAGPGASGQVQDLQGHHQSGGAPGPLLGGMPLKVLDLSLSSSTCFVPGTAVDVIYSASNRDNTGPGASGEVQDHQEHHRDDQEHLLDHFTACFIWI